MLQRSLLTEGTHRAVSKRATCHGEASLKPSGCEKPLPSTLPGTEVRAPALAPRKDPVQGQAPGRQGSRREVELRISLGREKEVEERWVWDGKTQFLERSSHFRVPRQLVGVCLPLLHGSG